MGSAQSFVGHGLDLGDGIANKSSITRCHTSLDRRAGASTGSIQTGDDDMDIDDLASGLRRLGAYAVAVLTLIAVAWIWEVDMALVQFLLDQPLWPVDAQTAVTVGDLLPRIRRHSARNALVAVHEYPVCRHPF